MEAVATVEDSSSFFTNLAADPYKRGLVIFQRVLRSWNLNNAAVLTVFAAAAICQWVGLQSELIDHISDLPRQIQESERGPIFR